MQNLNTYVLDNTEIEEVNGGFICGGACVLGAIVAGVGLFSSGVTIGYAFGS